MPKVKNAGVRKLALGLLCLIMVASLETFNSQLSGLTDDQLVQQSGDLKQQMAAIVLWAGIMLLSFIPGVARAQTSTRGILWPALLLAWVVISPIWSVDPASSGPKALVFLLASLAAWRMAFVVTAEEMFTCIFYTLGGMLLLSLLVVIFLRRPGRWHAHALSEAYQQAPELYASLGAILLGVCVGAVVNDTGVAIPTAASLVILPLLVAVAAKTRAATVSLDPPTPEQQSRVNK